MVTEKIIASGNTLAGKTVDFVKNYKKPGKEAK
jgi:hypothetical protein